MSRLDILENKTEQRIVTPYADSEVEILLGDIEQQRVAFLPRHGKSHTIPPHRINYRANIWALKEFGISDIIAINAVGGISPEMSTGQLAVPDQIIDYTCDREHTFFQDNLDEVVHIDFTHPYSSKLRQILILSIEEAGNAAADIDMEGPVPVTSGTYGCVQGPRLETAAEIARIRNDGCHMVGMTGMPEAALARELGLHYACLALSVNRAAGLESRPITMESINEILAEGMAGIRALLPLIVNRYANEPTVS